MFAARRSTTLSRRGFSSVVVELGLEAPKRPLPVTASNVAVQPEQLLSRRDRKTLNPKPEGNGPARKILNLLKASKTYPTRPELWAQVSSELNPESGFLRTHKELNLHLAWMRRHEWIAVATNPADPKANHVFKPLPRKKRSVLPVWANASDIGAVKKALLEKEGISVDEEEEEELLMSKQ